MKTARATGIAIFGVLALLALPSVAPAGASTLCSLNASPCPGVEYGAGTKVEAALAGTGKATFSTSLGTVSCTSSTVAGETTTAGGAGKAVEGTLSTMTFGGCKFGETACTMSTVNLPYSASVTGEGGNGTFAVKDASGVGATTKCGGFINCTYTTTEAKLKATGGNPAIAKAEAIPLTGTGLFCPAKTTWTAEYEYLQPKPLYVVAQPAEPPAFDPEEAYGEENPATPGIDPTCTGDPINCASGNLTLSQTDIAIEGRGPPLELTRSYNAQLAANQEKAGSFGYGWTGPYSARLSFDEEAETATVHHDNGSAVVFYTIEGQYFPAPWAQATLVEEGEGYLYTLPNQSELEFNGSGQLTKVADRHGNALTLTYKEGKLETVEDAASRALTFTYNVGGQVESVKDPMGYVVKYAYESGHLATVTLPGKETTRWKFKYDGSHRMTELTDGRGNTTKNEYDGSHRVTLQTDPLERKRKLEYKEAEGVRETTITEPNGSKTLETFNSAGQALSITKASGTELAQTTTHKYDASLNQVEVTDANEHTTTFGYDAEGNRISIKDPNGNEAKWTYTLTRDVKTMTTPKGVTTTYVRNPAGDAETIERPAPGGGTQKWTFKYAKNGDLESETDPLSRTTTFEYDSYGNRKAETNPAGDKRTWIFNEDSQLIAEVSPRGNEEGAEASKFETKYERDPQGRALTVTNPLGHTAKRAYDNNGNLETLTNGNGRTTTYTYDAADQLTKVKMPNGDLRETNYDSMGRVMSRTDGSKNVWKYERNLLGQITEETDPLERKTTKEYDATGNLEKVKDAEGRTITYTYDPGDRLTKIDYSAEATPDVAYEYDKDGNVIVMKDGTGTTKYEYDSLGRLTQVENGAEQLVKYESNLGEEQTKVTYPNGKSITRAYDKAGRLEKVTDWLSGETKFVYDRNSRLKSTTFPSGSTNIDEYAYDNADQLTKITMKKGAETLASLSYARDKAGQVESEAQTGLPGGAETVFAYDENDRLGKAGAAEFKYDAANNPISLAGTAYSYDKASQLEKGGGVTFTFNKVGQRTKATPESGPATTYGYDQAGNLISVSRPAEGEVKKIEDAYAYDGYGLRASQAISGSKANLAWDMSRGSCRCCSQTAPTATSTVQKGCRSHRSQGKKKSPTCTTTSSAPRAF